MTRFTTFALLYMGALFIELAKNLAYPGFAAGLLVLIALMLWRGITPAGFVLYLTVTTAHFLLARFPDVANHVNIIIYCNVFLTVAICYAWVRKPRFSTDEEVFELVRPILQVSLALVYVLAGFHKLNRDFLDPEVSCARTILGILATAPKSWFLGLPVALLVAAVVVPVGFRLLSKSRWKSWLPAIGVTAALATAGAAVVLAVAAAPGVSTVVRTAVLAMAVVIILWELGGGLLLTVPRFQLAVLVFSWAMHASLAVIRFVDFGALAFALLFSFVPRTWVDLLNRPIRLRGIRSPIPRAHVYAGLGVLAVIVGLRNWIVGGLIFNAAALIFLWPLIEAAVAPAPRPAWAGVPLTSPLTPRWMYLFPVVLLLHGLTSYLGLRSAGNFSMFSNLRTEGPTSNHLLLGSNPLKLWGYQDDLVEVTRLNHAIAWSRITNQHPLEGYRLPVVEFRKQIYGWAQAGKTIPITFVYKSRQYESPDITRDPVWRVDSRDWEMRLMDFRVIQPEGPNQCRW